MVEDFKKILLLGLLVLIVVLCTISQGHALGDNKTKSFTCNCTVYQSDCVIPVQSSADCGIWIKEYEKERAINKCLMLGEPKAKEECLLKLKNKNDR